MNAGNVASLTGEDDETLFKQLSENVRLAYGIGIAIRLGQMARFEINYCIPHSFDKQDEVNQGVQFGIGVQFV